LCDFEPIGPTPLYSAALSVGRKPRACFVRNVTRSSPPLRGLFTLANSGPDGLLFIVGQNEDALSSVGRTEGTSRKYNRGRDFVCCAFQVSAYLVEKPSAFKRNKPKRVFCHDERWPAASHDS
jgi:hypothetical protein